MATAAQLKAKANFKKAIAYRKKTGCSLKEAFAAVYPKKAAPVKRAKKSAPKKVAKKAAPKKKVGAVTPKKSYVFNAYRYKTNQKTGMYEVAEKKQFKISATNLQTAENNARKKYPFPYTTEYQGQKVGAVKKSAPKKKAISRHKDTNSHNVKISVVSGVNKAGNLAKYGGLIRDEKVKKVAIEYCKNRLKQLPVKERPALRRVIKQHEAELKVIKAQMLLQKKLI